MAITQATPAVALTVARARVAQFHRPRYGPRVSAPERIEGRLAEPQQEIGPLQGTDEALAATSTHGATAEPAPDLRPPQRAPDLPVFDRRSRRRAPDRVGSDALRGRPPCWRPPASWTSASATGPDPRASTGHSRPMVPSSGVPRSPARSRTMNAQVRLRSHRTLARRYEHKLAEPGPEKQKEKATAGAADLSHGRSQGIAEAWRPVPGTAAGRPIRQLEHREVRACNALQRCRVCSNGAWSLPLRES